ncbi:EH signature domain-containing protein [Tranquillimonas rosea]|nr:EH signature domain-containing protein [Tranquillimonas rosea]
MRQRAPLTSRVMPPLTSLDRAVARIVARWPDVVAVPEAKDREALAMEMLLRVTRWSWTDVKLSRVMSAAVAVFDADRRDRPDLAPVRAFYREETGLTDSPTFLKGMVEIYLESFDPGSPHTTMLADALSRRRSDFDRRSAALLEALPDLFAPARAPGAVAEVMLAAEDPYAALKALGFRSPHAMGLARCAHRDFLRLLAPKLRDADARRQLFAWLAPSRNSVLQAGAGLAVEALLRAWGDRMPPDEVRGEITEFVVSVYNDPRTHQGGIWSAFDATLKAIFLRWLTKQDMLFFCDMVTATQTSHMWAPRRNFWLGLYEDGRIDEAWVAFGSSARDYAQRNLLRSGATDINRRFGRQHDRGGSTSLLIMRIGNKIVVDGCHSYRTHIFRRDDPDAPALYGQHYYCDRIMRRSRNAKSHSSIPAWADWVTRNV